MNPVLESLYRKHDSDDHDVDHGGDLDSTAEYENINDFQAEFPMHCWSLASSCINVPYLVDVSHGGLSVDLSPRHQVHRPRNYVLVMGVVLYFLIVNMLSE